MPSLVKFAARHLISKLFIAITASFIFAPSLFFILHPEKDFLYHAMNKKIVKIKKFEGIRDNSYINISGSVDKKSIVFKTDLLNSELKSCTFRLKEYPENFVVFIRNGDYFDFLNQVYRFSKKSWIVKYLDDKKNGMNESLKLRDEWNINNLDPRLAKVLKILEEKKNFEGRVYSSRGYMEPFESYYFRKKLDIEDYYFQIGEAMKYDSEFESLIKKNLKIENDSHEYYLLVVDEKPSIPYLVNTNFSLFLIILIPFPGIIFFIYIILKNKYKDKTNDNRNTKTSETI